MWATYPLLVKESVRLSKAPQPAVAGPDCPSSGARQIRAAKKKSSYRVVGPPEQDRSPSAPANSQRAAGHLLLRQRVGLERSVICGFKMGPTALSECLV